MKSSYYIFKGFVLFFKKLAVLVVQYYSTYTMDFLYSMNLMNREVTASEYFRLWDYWTEKHFLVLSLDLLSEPKLKYIYI